MPDESYREEMLRTLTEGTAALGQIQRRAEGSVLAEGEIVTYGMVLAKASAVVEAVTAAYNAAVNMKLLMDRMEELPSRLRTVYARNGTVMHSMGQASKDAYQTQMELRRDQP